MQGRDQKVKDTCSQHSCWQDVHAQYLPSHCYSSFLFSSEMIFLLQLPTPETFHSLPSLHISDQPLKLPPGQSTASRLCPHHPPRAPRVLLGHPLTEQTVSPDSPAPAWPSPDACSVALLAIPRLAVDAAASAQFPKFSVLSHLWTLGVPFWGLCLNILSPSLSGCIILFFLIMCLFIWLLQVLVAAQEPFSCGMWDLVPWPGMEAGSPALGT